MCVWIVVYTGNFVTRLTCSIFWARSPHSESAEKGPCKCACPTKSSWFIWYNMHTRITLHYNSESYRLCVCTTSSIGVAMVKKDNLPHHLLIDQLDGPHVWVVRVVLLERVVEECGCLCQRNSAIQILRGWHGSGVRLVLQQRAQSLSKNQPPQPTFTFRQTDYYMLLLLRWEWELLQYLPSFPMTGKPLWAVVLSTSITLFTFSISFRITTGEAMILDMDW